MSVLTSQPVRFVILESPIRFAILESPIMFVILESSPICQFQQANQSGLLF